MQKVNSIPAKLNLPVLEGLQKAFVENDAIFHKKSIIKYRPNLERKLEENPEIEKCTFTIF